ncbi:MAG TPA: hydrogenase [Gammaproteobacteria bacterium]|nr:hydrogenase [Gammaproteobacteria bacterium]
MLITHLSPLAASLFSLLTIVSLLLAFVMLGSHWLKNHVYAFAAESWLIAALSATVGYYGHYPELYLIAVLTALFRGSLLPYLLMRIVARLNVKRELTLILLPSSSIVLGGLLVLFAFAVSVHLGRSLGIAQTIAVLALTALLSLKLIGFLLMALRSEAVSHILGILVIENGIFLGSQILVPGMPMILELVILFDLLVAVTCFGLLINYLIAHAGTTSSHGLKRLVG